MRTKPPALLKELIKTCLQRTFPKYIVFVKLPQQGITITFDDGPHPVNTPRIIDSLAKLDIKAIFFSTGKDIEKYPDMAKLVVEKGHILGNHTYEHLDLRKCSFGQYKYSLEKTNRIISKFQQTPHILFRPPYGRVSLQLIRYIVSTKSIIMNWTIDSGDSFIRNPDNLLVYIKRLSFSQGDILLFHEDYDHTVTVLNDILNYCKDQGFEFTLPQLEAMD